MEGPVLIVGADKAECQELCEALKREGYQAVPFQNLHNLEGMIQKTGCRSVILDLDSLPVDDRFITKVRGKNPGLPIIGLSSRPFHPELEKAMSTHICACIGKPPDMDELVYCLKSFSENALNKKGEREGR